MRRTLIVVLTAGLALACGGKDGANEPTPQTMPRAATSTDAPAGKFVVYQVFTRLFGNTTTNNIPWGTVEQNGVGTFADFDDTALDAIRALGVTHVWYTGVPHHAVIGDYTDHGISADDPDVVKGRAGSPYAVKDYYTVNPDLAEDPARRLEAFDALIARTHDHGMKVIIDIVPNHVARDYTSLARPDGVRDFGADDDTAVAYARDNNFYYVVGEDFRVPEWPADYAPLGGERHPLADGQFDESPAKWTGNGARAAQPGFNDWYETVKVNYGVRPDGTHDFDDLPASYAARDCAAHRAFWAERDVPDSWEKFRDIALYWTARGVDGFRYDMAELVPVAFWSYLNCAIKAANPDAFLLAEVYNPDLYRDYLRLGKMDYLYDKVGFYDTLRPVMAGRAAIDGLPGVHASVAPIADHMLHFLENHDEQRIASDAFAGDARMGIPGMTVSALISRAPVMLYFGQHVGEPGDGDAGFGDPTRTTIFDYWGVPTHQAWMNGGAFDGGALTDEQRALHRFYETLLRFARDDSSMRGAYLDLHAVNRADTPGYDDRMYAFARWNGARRVVVVANFNREARQVAVRLPEALANRWLPDAESAELADVLSDRTTRLLRRGDVATIDVALGPMDAMVLTVTN